jgi:hypothetical protein
LVLPKEAPKILKNPILTNRHPLILFSALLSAGWKFPALPVAGGWLSKKRIHSDSSVFSLFEF